MLPKYLIIAMEELDKGVAEIAGSKANPRIVDYHQTCSLKATSDEVPWCSAFVNWCIEQAGLKGTKSAAAISWAKWGREIEFGQLGSIVVMSRPGGNHVGFYLDETDSGIIVLGGNQSNQVCIRTFSWDIVSNFRMPN